MTRNAASERPTLAREVVLPLLTTETLGRDFHYVERTGSTNTLLDALAQGGAAEGSVVVAGEQSAGKGRMARGWFSPPGGGIYFSLLLRPEVTINSVSGLPLVLGLAVSKLCDRWVGEKAALVKWPNDVLIGGRKCCGILCEMRGDPDRVEYVVAGIGLNVNIAEEEFPAEVRERAIALGTAAGRELPRAEMLADLLLLIERYYREWLVEGLKPFLPRLARRDALAERKIEVRKSSGMVVGRAAGLNPDGSLRLELGDGEIRSIYSGDAHIGT